MKERRYTPSKKTDISSSAFNVEKSHFVEVFILRRHGCDYWHAKKIPGLCILNTVSRVDFSGSILNQINVSLSSVK